MENTDKYTPEYITELLKPFGISPLMDYKWTAHGIEWKREAFMVHETFSFNNTGFENQFPENAGKFGSVLGGYWWKDESIGLSKRRVFEDEAELLDYLNNYPKWINWYSDPIRGKIQAIYAGMGGEGIITDAPLDYDTLHKIFDDLVNKAKRTYVEGNTQFFIVAGDVTKESINTGHYMACSEEGIYQMMRNFLEVEDSKHTQAVISAIQDHIHQVKI